MLTVVVGAALGLAAFALMRISLRSRYGLPAPATSVLPRGGHEDSGIESQVALVAAGLLIGQAWPLWHFVLPHAPAPLAIAVVAFAVFIDAALLTLVASPGRTARGQTG